MSLNPSLIPHPSEQHAAWEKALHSGAMRCWRNLQRAMILPLLFWNLKATSMGSIVAASPPYPNRCRISASRCAECYPTWKKFGIAWDGKCGISILDCCA